MPHTLENVREIIRTGDFLFVRGTKVFSWWIKLWSRSRYSHVAICVRIHVGNEARMCIVESMEGVGVRLLTIEDFLRRNPRTDWYALREVADQCVANRHAIAIWCVNELGQPYARWTQFLRAFSLVTRKVLNALRVPADVDPDGRFCSEFVLEALLAGGAQLPTDIEPARTPPGDVALLPLFLNQGGLTL